MEEDYSVYISKEKAEEIKSYISTVTEQICSVVSNEEQLKDYVLKVNPLVTKEERLALAIARLADIWKTNASYEFCLQVANELYSNYRESRKGLEFNPNNILVELGIKTEEPVANKNALIAKILKNLPDFPKEKLIKLLSITGYVEPEKVLEMAQTLEIEELEEQVPLFQEVKFKEGTPEFSRGWIVTVALFLYAILKEKPITQIEGDLALGLYLAKQIHERFPEEYLFVKKNLLEAKVFNPFALEMELRAAFYLDNEDPILSAVGLFEAYYQTYENSDHLLQQLHKKLADGGYARIFLNDYEDRGIIYEMYHEWCGRNEVDELWEPAKESTPIIKDVEWYDWPRLPKPEKLNKSEFLLLKKWLVENGFIQNISKDSILFRFGYMKAYELKEEPSKIAWLKGLPELRYFLSELYGRNSKQNCEAAVNIFQKPNGKGWTANSLYRAENIEGTDVGRAIRKQIEYYMQN